MELALQDKEDWALSSTCFESICSRLTVNFVPSLDLFASRLNHKCERYFSFRQDPNAVGTDALSDDKDWSTELAYAAPPPPQPHHQGTEEAETRQRHSPTAGTQLGGQSLGPGVQEHGDIRDADVAPLRGGRASGQGGQASEAIKDLAGCHSFTNPLLEGKLPLSIPLSPARVEEEFDKHDWISFIERRLHEQGLNQKFIERSATSGVRASTSDAKANVWLKISEWLGETSRTFPVSLTDIVNFLCTVTKKYRR